MIIGEQNMDLKRLTERLKLFFFDKVMMLDQQLQAE
jgi:hypothetical protein